MDIDLIHCDGRILHAPTKCIYCDKYPERQALREMWGINFTGEYDTDKIVCPSEQRRPLEVINRWHGNVPMTEENAKIAREEQKKFMQELNELYEN